jgi:hypothetical protein
MFVVPLMFGIEYVIEGGVTTAIVTVEVDVPLTFVAVTV